jgi:PAS domain S-box-containing protein
MKDITGQKQAKEELQRRARTIQTLLDAASQAIIGTDSAGRIALANRMTESMFGHTSDELIGRPLEMLLCVEAGARYARHLEGSSVYPPSNLAGNGLTLDCRRKDGSLFPVELTMRRIETSEGKLVLGFITDLSSRKLLERRAERSLQQIEALAARLLTAQEEERRRVSRELHDDLCQQLASLAFDMGGLAAGEGPSSPAQHRLRALQARVIKASEDARHIAYQLHPSILEDLGLTVSLQAFCEEFSSREMIAVGFSATGFLDSIPREIASCLYRISQEALNNVARHAQAKHASVSLTGLANGVKLLVEDDGVGFDPEVVRSHPGLGLVSMQERARIVRGELSIESQPGRGARIALHVPLPESQP